MFILTFIVGILLVGSACILGRFIGVLFCPGRLYDNYEWSGVVVGIFTGAWALALFMHFPDKTGVWILVTAFFTIIDAFIWGIQKSIVAKPDRPFSR